MSADQQINPVPWDQRAFGIDCFEIANPDAETLARALATPGHYTARIAPLAEKQTLHEHGFYYCDTLIEPWCTPGQLAQFRHPDAVLDSTMALEAVLEICHGAFAHGRFHRDFGLDSRHADARYDNWLRELHRDGNVYGLRYRGEPAGFVARSGACLVLHAMSRHCRGQGLAKYFWSMVGTQLFAEGLPEIRSSISAANLAAVNLYATLGFRFRNAVDIYHRKVP